LKELMRLRLMCKSQKNWLHWNLVIKS
jgi:hypothetical protein